MSHCPTMLESVAPVEIQLRDGRTMTLRALAASDRVEHQLFVERLSKQSSRLRFFVPLRTLGGAQQDAYFDLDYRDRLALVAVFADDPAIHAVGRYAKESDGVAEVALVVDDALQGFGVGTALLDRLARLARQRGLKTFSALVLPENAAMLGLFGRTGWATHMTRTRDATHLEMALPGGSQDEVPETTMEA